MTEKQKGLLTDAAIYFGAFGAASIPFAVIEDMFLASAAFTAAATLFIFIFSTILKDVSVYDPYWSVAPPIMLLAVMLKYNIWTLNAFILMALFLLWSTRLTLNWYYTYPGLGHEDWRYAQYREKCSPFLFHVISFVGLHFVPTIVVWLGFVSALLAIRVKGFAPACLFGAAVMIAAVLLEYTADQAIHKFLREHRGEHKTCNISVWKYSRHPNYLGEMSFWTGLWLYFVACRPADWYLGLGFLSIIILFLTVSIPMMERHNAERRVDYAEYKEKTSMLLLWPSKK